MYNNIILQFSLFILSHDTEDKRMDMLRTLHLQKLIFLHARCFLQYLLCAKIVEDSAKLIAEFCLQNRAI